MEVSMKRLALMLLSTAALVAGSLGTSPPSAQAAATCSTHSLGVPDASNPKHFTWHFKCSADFRITFFLEDDRQGSFLVAHCQSGSCAIAHPAAPAWFSGGTDHQDTAGFNVVSPDTPVCNFRWRASAVVSFKNGDPVLNYNSNQRATC
jgi:hypothetical protein